MTTHELEAYVAFCGELKTQIEKDFGITVPEREFETFSRWMWERLKGTYKEGFRDGVGDDAGQFNTMRLIKEVLASNLKPAFRLRAIELIVEHTS